MGTLVCIKPDGTEERIEAKKPDYEVLNRLVGGYIERVRVRYEGRIRDCYVNEDGFRLTLEPNEHIRSKLAGVFEHYQGVILGNGVVWVR